MKSARSQIEQGLIDGAVVLAGDSRSDLFSCALGFADRSAGRPMTMETIFDVASVTKPVGTNSVLLAALTDGLLELDRPFTDYLPDFTGAMPCPVTVRELSLHISGVRLAYSLEGTREDMRRAILRSDFPNPPRRVYQYTCTSHILIGMMLEHLYGRPLDKIASERVFRPLGMTDTRWVRPVEGGLERTIRTINAEPGVISDPGARLSAPLPFGNAGLFTTAGDLAKYARMMLRNDGSVFPPEILDLCFHDFNPPEVKHPHAIGWDMMPDMIPAGLSPRTVFHSGWTGQTVWVDPGTDRFVLVLTNRMREWDRAKFGRKEIAEEALGAIP